MSQEVNLSTPQQFNATSLKPINLFLAGVGSGKTHLGGVLAWHFARKFPEVRGMIAANTYMQLTQSTMLRIREVWKDEFGITENKHYVVDKKPPSYFDTENHNFDDYYNIISFWNGAVVFKASLDKAKVHEGKEIGWCICDETKDSREEDIKNIILPRLRQRGIYIGPSGLTTENTGKSFTPFYILTSPAKVEWINEWFELDEHEGEILATIYDENDFFRKEFKNKCVTISSTYHNQENLTDTYIENLLMSHTDREGKLKESGERLVYGNPFVKTGGEFYSSFNRQVHAADVELIENHPIHISYDFNVVPYITLTCWQIISEGEIVWVRAFDEFCLPSPKNTTETVTREFMNKYDDKLKYGLFYYGDPTGSARDTRGRRNDYDIIRDVLKGYLNNFSKRVRYRAHPVILRRNFANKIFDERYNIRILVGRNCKKIIADFEYLKEDSEGKKLKEKVKDGNTGQTYEKYGHTSDSFDYFITEAFPKEFKR
jgi:hypothetical protein